MNDASVPNKAISAYVYLDGVIQAAIFSSIKTDASGKVTANLKKVDANKCPTTENFIPSANTGYNFHVRLDSTGTSSFVWPTACGGSQGFLDNAQVGADYKIYPSNNANGSFDYSQNLVSNTGTISLTLSSTGISSGSKLAVCTLSDSGMINPIWDTPNVLAAASATVTFTGGNGSPALTSIRADTGQYYASPYNVSYLKYACYIDANGSGGYNSGDLVASGSLTTFSQSITTWTPVP